MYIYIYKYIYICIYIYIFIFIYIYTHIGKNVMPIDELIVFQRGRYTTNQKWWSNQGEIQKSCVKIASNEWLNLCGQRC